MKETRSFDHVPADGSRKMDDTLMESIEPYDFKDAVPFQQAYLAGYLADRYDVNVDERIDTSNVRESVSVPNRLFERPFGDIMAVHL